MTKARRADEWGRVVIDSDQAFDLAYRGVNIWSIPVTDSDAVKRFNELCSMFDKTDYIIEPPEPHTNTPEEEHQQRIDNWLITDDIRSIAVRDFLISMCETDVERARVHEEMDLFEERDLIPLLQLMIYLVDYFRANNIVWGVGRGSSVASYCLYLIGIHRVDSLRYGLDITEFLK